MSTGEVQSEDVCHLVVVGKTRSHDPGVVREPHTFGFQFGPGAHAMVSIESHAIAIKLDGDQHAVGTDVCLQRCELVVGQRWQQLVRLANRPMSALLRFRDGHGTLIITRDSGSKGDGAANWVVCRRQLISPASA
jgi:hypothetical protein